MPGWDCPFCLEESHTVGGSTSQEPWSPEWISVSVAVFFLLGFRRGAHVVCLEIAGHGHFKADGKFCSRGAKRLFVVCACPSSGFAWCCPVFSSSAWLSGSVQELVPVRTHNRAAGCFLPCPFFCPGPGCSREPLDLLFSVKGVDTASI